MSDEEIVNESGYEPFEYKVLVKPTYVDKKTKGGLFLPDNVHDREGYEMQEGIIVAIGAIAFTDPDWLDKPRAGDKILFNKFGGGAIIDGEDGDKYRIMPDREILAKITR